MPENSSGSGVKPKDARAGRSRKPAEPARFQGALRALRQYELAQLHSLPRARLFRAREANHEGLFPNPRRRLKNAARQAASSRIWRKILTTLRFKKNAIAAAIVVPFALFSAGAMSAQAAADMKPGTYTASARGNSGPVEVTIEVTKDAIKSVKIGKNYETPYIAADAMESVAKRIVEEQNLAIDTVSGATRSTGAVLTAVAAGISKAGGDSDAFTRPFVPVDPAALPMGPTVQTQIVVIGGGASGLAAAAAAADAGAKVIVLEKMGVLGGSALLSGGGITAAGTKLQKEEDISVAPEALDKYWIDSQKRSIPGGYAAYPDKQFVAMMSKESAKTVDWLADKVGVDFAEPRAFGAGGEKFAHAPDDADTPANGRGTVEGGGKYEIEALVDFCKEKGVEFRLNTPAYELIQDKNGRITGVMAHNGKERITFQGQAVVLASGGFGRSLEMVAHEVPRWAVYVDKAAAAKGSTGDGIKMADKAGAQLAKDSWMIGLSLTPVYKALIPAITTDNKFQDNLLVNEHGKRFVREDLPYLADAVSEQLESWFIFDSSDEKRTKIIGDYLTYNVAVHGSDLRELGRRMGADAYALEKEIGRYNEFVKAGEDKDFGKAKEFLHPVEKAPFYAVKVFPVINGTMGGVAVNDKFQVLNKKNQPIAGLYAGGEMANRAFYNRVYVEGSSLAIAYTSGRLIGEAAAASLKK